MADASDPLRQIDYLTRRADYVNWHRQQRQQQILRSQRGFSTVVALPANLCHGCAHYHGVAYGHSTRTVLVCGFHPPGWLGDGVCPDRRTP